jgi:hypothetical protein
MANKTGIAITIKAFIETGKDMASQFKAMSAVMSAKDSGDYNELFKLVTVEEMKSEQVTRRAATVAATTTATAPATTAPADTSAASGEAAGEVSEPAGTVGGAQIEGDDEPAQAAASEEEPAEVPAFLRSGAVAA